MRIGEVAARLSLAPSTLRYYEARGLLPSPKRSAAGYRSYDDDAFERLRFIQRARALDLSLDEYVKALDEIRSVLTLSERGDALSLRLGACRGAIGRG